MNPSDSGDAFTLGPGERFGPYRIVRLLGRGGMGSVFEAESVEDGRRVALKILPQDLDDPDLRRRFLREGHLAASLNHPNTVYIYGTGEAEGTLFIAMELVAGGTLEDRVQERGPLPISEAIEDALQIVDGLAAAHALGILHRDIKPSNLFVGIDGALKVGDFGLSKATAPTTNTTLTQAGMFIGTPAFAAPEQMLGEPLDLRSDIYSVGATLYYILTAKVPFEAPNALQMIATVLQGSPTSPKAHRAEIPDRLAEIVLRCLARQREDRYPDYESLRIELDALREKAAVPAPVPVRAAALAIDSGLAIALGLLLMMIPGALELIAVDGARASLLQCGLVVLCLLLAKGIPESLWGASAGKALLGIRLERKEGSPLGLARGSVRLAVLYLPFLATAWLPDSRSGDWISETLGYVILIGGCLAIVVTMRRTNGFAGLHDRLVGSRVVLPTRAVSARRPVRKPEPAPSIPASAEHLGQFRVIGTVLTLQGGTRVDLAFDPTLRRAVWVHRRSPGHPALTDQRRDLAREGRLRWVASRRTEDQDWDAYEAPEGKPLLASDTPAVSWEVARGWLRDLATELVASQDAKESLTLGLDRVWVAPCGALLLDFPMAMNPGVSEAPKPGPFLEQVARRALLGPGGEHAQSWPVLPLHARSFLDDLPTLNDPAAFLARLGTIQDAPVALDRRKRGLAVAIAAGPALAVTLTIWCGFQFAVRLDPEMARLQPLIQYLHSPRGRDSDSTAAANRRTIGIYLASNHHERLADPSRRGGFWGGMVEWQEVDSVLSLHRGASVEERDLAKLTVETVWRGSGPASSRIQSPALSIGLGAFMLTLTGLLSVLAALLFRTGWAFRVAGIEAVSSSGRKAGRARLVLRTFLVWLPFVLAPMLLFNSRLPFRIGKALAELIRLRPATNLPATALTLVMLSLLIFGVVALISALRNPRRGLVDRIAGTHLVPR